MENPKVLVACPTSRHHRYCMKDFVNAIKNFTYPNFDVLVAENSKDDGYYHELKNAGVNVVKAPWIEGIIPRIVESRNILREYMLENKYDYYFSMDQDTIPVHNDIIERLMRHDKDIVSGIYFTFKMVDGKAAEVPVCWTDYDEASNTMQYLDVRHLAKPQLFEVSAFGMGCVLAKREVMEKIKFRYDEKHHGAFEDMFFCHDARNLGYKLYIDTTARCDHITIGGGKWKNETTLY